MTSALTILGGENAQLPAHLAVLEGKDNIVERESTPALSFKGKTWQMRINGEVTLLTRRNEDGDAEPTPIVKLVVLNINPNRSRTFYAGNYEEGKNKSPDCWSSDGVHPDKDVKLPVFATCAGCPNSVKGSKITENGKESTACTAVKRIAVVPAARLDMEPMLLKIPQTSIWDKNNGEHEAKGFYAWDQYVDFLRSRGLKHTAGVVTKIKFDPNVAYPKLLFTAERWLTAEEIAQVAPLIETEAVKKLLTGRLYEGGDEPAPAAPAKPAVDSDDDGFDQVTATPAPAKQAKPAPAPAVAPAADPDDGDDGFGTTPVTAAAPVTKPAKAKAAKSVTPENVTPAVPVVTGTPADLAALAADWDD